MQTDCDQDLTPVPVRSKNAKFHASLNSNLCQVEVQQFVGIVSCKTRPCSANHFYTKPDVQQQNMPRYPPPCRSISALLQSVLGGLSRSNGWRKTSRQRLRQPCLATSGAAPPNPAQTKGRSWAQCSSSRTQRSLAGSPSAPKGIERGLTRLLRSAKKMPWTPAASDVSHQHDASWSFVPSVYNLTIFEQSYVPK